MGDPKRPKKKFSRPLHPWRRARLEDEKVLVEEYGLRNKKDLWKMTSTLGHFKSQAKALIARKGVHAEKEKELFLGRLQRLKLIGAGATIDDVLSLAVRDVLERRLQTILYRKGLAHSVLQARQFIVHRHVSVNGQKMDVPSYLVPVSEEELISFDQRSPFADVEHPERQVRVKSPEGKKNVKKEGEAEAA